MRKPGSRTEVLSTGFTLIWSNLNRYVSLSNIRRPASEHSSNLIISKLALILVFYAL